MWMWDIVHDEIWITDKGRAMLGFDASEKLDFDRFRSRLHPDDRELVLQAVDSSLRTGAEYQSEYRVVLPDGQLRWIAGRGQVEFDGDGQPVRMRGVSVDITKRKQAELETARHRNEIAHLSRVTTVGELSGSLAHELNRRSAPSSAMRKLPRECSPMATSTSPSCAKSLMTSSAKTSARAKSSIGLRLWLQKGEVQQHSLRINEVVGDVLKLIRTDLINQHVTVAVELGRNLPLVTGDPVQLQQVLVNLVVNACDAMIDRDAPERRLRIRTGTRDPERDGTAQYCVRHRSWWWHSREKMEQIFEPFFTTKAKGMGLGLSVCHTIIAAHRGKLWATNNADAARRSISALPKDASASKTNH